MRRASILSPAFLDVPIGWNIVYEEASRQSRLEYVEYNWKDLNPKVIKFAKTLAGKR